MRCVSRASPRCAAITNPSCWPAASARLPPATRKRRRLRLRIRLSCSVARPCSSASAAGRRLLWRRGPWPPSWTSPRCNATTPRCNADASKCWTIASRSAEKTRFGLSTTWARAAWRTRCRSWCMPPGAARASSCGGCRALMPACRLWNCGATKRKSAMCWRSPRKTSTHSRRFARASVAHTRLSGRPRSNSNWWWRIARRRGRTQSRPQGRSSYRCDSSWARCRARVAWRGG